MNPKVGSEVQHPRGAREEEAGEVVENHEVGTWSGGGTPVPTEKGGRATGDRAPGVDSPVIETTKGIFEQPQERMLVPR